MGKFSDRFMNTFGLKDDDDDYDEYDDDEYYDDDEEYDTSEEEYDEPEPAPAKSRPFAKTSKKNPPVREERVASGYNSRSASNEVCVFKPSSIEDSKEITETLLQGKAVVVNFEGLHVEISQRIIDFISGSCYAIDGNLQKISNYIFIATPDGVDLSGDFQSLVGDDSSFDISGFKSPLI